MHKRIICPQIQNKENEYYFNTTINIPQKSQLMSQQKSQITQKANTRPTLHVSLASASSCLIVNFLTNPLEVAKLRAQYSPATCDKYPHTSLKQILTCSCSKSLTYKDFFKGLSVSLPLSVTTNMLYMTCYQKFREKLRGEIIQNNSLATFTSALSARAIVSMVLLPFEAFRIRFTNSTAQKIIKGGKLGTRVSLMRDLSYSSSMWLTLETVRSLLLKQQYRDSNKKFSDDLLRITIIPAAVGTSLASFLTNPFDTLKTRLQCGLNYGAQQTVLGQLRYIHKKEGWIGMFFGFHHRLGRNLASAIMYITLYEYLLDQLKAGNLEF